MNPALPLVSGALSAAASRALVARNPDAVSNQAEEHAEMNALLPEGAAFAIWGPIYLGLFGLTVAQALPSQAEAMAAARPWLAITPPLHATWYALTSREDGSLKPMLVLMAMLASALKLHQALPERTGKEGEALQDALRPAAALYAGWLTAANLPGWTAVALERGWRAKTPPPRVWGTLGVLLGAGLGALGSRKLDDPWFEVSFVNALAGIAVRQWRRERPVVALTAGALAVAGAVSVAVRLWKRRAGR